MNAKPIRNYKDTVFTDLFYSDESASENLLSFYNATHGTGFKDPSIIKKVRLENVLFANFKNDVAFTAEERRIILKEHQGSVNPNMPLRKLMYVAREYEQLADSRAKYSSSLVKIPTPEFITLYNGRAYYPDKQILRLSDAFLVKDTAPMLELEDLVLNINPGHNEELKNKCPVLKQYTEFVECTRKYGTDKNALEKAVKECMVNGILSDYLSRKGSEVINMLMAEYNYNLDMQVHVEEAERERTKKKVRKKLVCGKSLETIAEELDEESSLIHELAEEIQSENKSSQN